MDNMGNNKIITGLFVGDGDILPMCAGMFMKKGGKIAAVHTCNIKNEQWARETGISCLDTEDIKCSSLQELNYDYLFNITDSDYPDYEICRRAGKAAIKLNLGILPEYAGANTTFWVLNNGEIKHGVTWHLVNDDLEEEDIVKQSIFYVKAGDTAATLLKKCYDAAAETFNSLVDDIFDGGITKIKQDLSRRVYTSKYQKPVLAGIVNWEQPAEKILKLINNLNHGNFINYITLPKIRIENDIYIIERMGLTGQSSEHYSGTVVNVSEEGIVIATKTNNVILHKITDVYGKPVSISKIIRSYNIGTGYRFQYLSDNCIKNLLDYDLEINKNEEYWVSQLNSIELDESRGERNKTNIYDTISIHPEFAVQQEFIKKSGLPESSIVRALFMLYILKEAGKTNYSFGLYNNSSVDEINRYVNLLSPIIPVNIHAVLNDNLNHLIHEIDYKIRTAASHKTFYNDIFARYPSLKFLRNNNLYSAAIAQVDKIENYKDIEEVLITFINTDDNKYYLNFNSAGFTDQEIESRIKDFYRFIQDITVLDEEQYNGTETNAPRHNINSLCRIGEVVLPEYESASVEKEVLPDKKVVFMFPWEGMVFQNSAAEMYTKEPVFRNAADNCFNILQSKYNLNLKSCIFPGIENISIKKKTSDNPLIILISTFIIEYSLAKFWMALGVKPSAMIGHSAGEYSAACLAGVFSLEDTLRLLITQSKLLAGLPQGEMLSISKNQSEIADYLHNDISLAAVNGNNLCVLAGVKDGIASLLDAFNAKKIESCRLNLKYPEHSRLWEPFLYDYKYEFNGIELNKPGIPFISSTTGDWITEEDALNCNYWAEQPAKTIKFEAGISRLLSDKENIFLEIGPGRSLVYLLSLHNSNKIISSPTLRCAGEKISDIEAVNRAIYFLERNKIKINFFNYESRASYFKGKDILNTRNSLASENESMYDILNETQLYIADLWKEMLEVETVNTEDSFINLGGNSLLLTRCINAIDNYFNISLPLKKVFKEPTIKNIEQLIYNEENKHTPGQIFIKPAIRDLSKNKAYAAN